MLPTDQMDVHLGVRKAFREDPKTLRGIKAGLEALRRGMTPGRCVEQSRVPSLSDVGPKPFSPAAPSSCWPSWSSSTRRYGALGSSGAGTQWQCGVGTCRRCAHIIWELCCDMCRLAGMLGLDWYSQALKDVDAVAKNIIHLTNLARRHQASGPLLMWTRRLSALPFA